MREIKFRAFIQSQDGSYICNYSDVLFPHIFWNNVYKGIYDTDPEQHIGIKDKNGVDIYEGDIFLIDSDCRGGIYIVSWNDKKANFCLFKKGWVINLAQTIGTVKYRKPEILGNQYENSELIKDNDNAF